MAGSWAAIPRRSTPYYQTEEAWIAGEIVRDITEMSAYTADRTARPNVRQPEPLGGGRYKVLQVATLTSAVELDLADGPWSPAQFAVLARAALGRASRELQAVHARPAMAVAAAIPTVQAFAEREGRGGVRSDLTEMTPAQIVKAARSVSEALSTDMRDARAHDSAALVLGAFALRESAGVFSDVRWALNRMTAHLAMAAALRGADEPASIDGALAEVILNILTRHQARALDQLARLGARTPSASLDAWRRALQVHVTQDWRAITLTPSTTGLEELEYLRARRQTVLRQRGIVEAETLQVERADALRIVSAEGIGVEDGHVIAQEGLDHEREEAAQVFQMIHDRPAVRRAGSALEGFAGWAHVDQRRRHAAQRARGACDREERTGRVAVGRMGRVLAAAHRDADRHGRSLLPSPVGG